MERCQFQVPGYKFFRYAQRMTESTSIKRLKPPHRAEVTLTFSAAEVAPAEERALQEFSRQLKLPGFRPGKVPVDIIKEKVSAEQLLEETIRHLLPEAFEQLVKEHNLRPIIPPHVEAISREPLVIRIIFVEKPAVTLKGVGKIKIAKTEPKADDKDVQRMIDYVLKQHQKTVIVDRPAQTGDRVTVDFHGTDAEGNAVEGTRIDGHHVILGSKTLIPGFEDQLVGLKAGESKSFTLNFPADYRVAELQGKAITFHAQIKQVESVDTPQLTDDFAKSTLGAESAAAFRAQVLESMRKQEEDIDRKRREEKLLDAIRDATLVEVGPELESSEVRSLYEELEEQLRQRQLTVPEWLKRTGKTPEEIEKELRDKALKRLTLRLGLQQLVEEKGQEIAEEEMKGIVNEFLAPLSEEERAQIDPSYEPGERAYEQLKWQTRVERVLGAMLKL